MTIDVPEFNVRPEAVAFLESRPRWSNRIMRCVNVLNQLVHISEPGIATSMLDLYWRERVLPLLHRLREEHEADHTTHRGTAQVWSSLRNVRANAEARVPGGRVRYSKNDVRRPA